MCTPKVRESRVAVPGVGIAHLGAVRGGRWLRTAGLLMGGVRVVWAGVAAWGNFSWRRIVTSISKIWPQV
jgi:hypothetical protein